MSEAQATPFVDPHPEKRRRTSRMRVRFPIEVRGVDRSGIRFDERTISEDLCRQGAAFQLSREIDLGTSLEIEILLPRETPQGQRNFSTQGLVRHVKQSEGGPIVGVEFVGPQFQRVFWSESSNPS